MAGGFDSEPGHDSELDEDDTVSMSTDREPDVEAGGEPGDEPDEGGMGGVDDDPTVIVDPEEHDTVIVPPSADTTVRVSRPEHDTTVPVAHSAHDSTVRVSHRGSSLVRPAMVPPAKRRRGELRPAPVPSGFGGMPVVASGAGVVSAYRVREIPVPPARLAEPDTTSLPDRVVGGVASVRRRSRVVSIVTIAAFVGSIAVLLGGLVWAIRDLVGA